MTERELSLKEILELEPEINRIIDRAVSSVDSYPSVWHAYAACKRKLSELVGWEAANEKLCTSRDYERAIRYLCVRLKI